MALGVVTINDAFGLTLTRMNSLILFMNELTEGQANSTGIITLTGGGFRDNVTMNVANGQIKGDGGAIVNVGASFTKIAGQANNTLIQNNYINLISNSVSLTISPGNTSIGSRAFFNVFTTSRINDQSLINVALAFAVNVVSNVAASAYDKANAANILAAAVSIGPAFDKANAANILAAEANTIPIANALANGYTLIRSAGRTIISFREDSTSPDIKINVDDDSAGDRGNITFAAPGIGLAFNKANAGNASAEAGQIQANAAYRAANSAQTLISTVFAQANADFISLILNGALTAYNNVNVVPYCTYPFSVDYAYYRLNDGTSVRIQVRNGTTNVSNLSALTSTTAGQRNVATGLNTFAVGDRMQITITNSSSAEKNLEMVFAITRTSP